MSENKKISNLPYTFKWYYVVFAAPVYLIMLLPLPVLYLISDIFIWLARDVIKYRKKVIRENLTRAFPDKNTKELLQIEREYYRHMIDVFIETFKALTMTKQEMIQRVKFNNMEEITKYFDKGKSVVLVLGHYGNWEWGGFSFTYHSPQKTNTLYHPLSNKFFDWLTYHIRSRCGMHLIPMQNTMRYLLATQNEIALTAFIADQSPSHQNAYWTTFLHQDTAFFTGPEKVAVKLNYPVVYATIDKIKRGYYRVHFQTISANPTNEQENTITEKFVRALEQDIITKPHLWLWSHRRWKHKRNPINLPT